jgi:membrane peptidoglycan carboxypeptidase
MIKYINSRRLNMRKSNKRKKKAINWKIFSRKLMVSFLIIAIAGLAGLIGVFAVAARDLPKWDPELLSGAKTTIIYDDKEEFAAGLHAGENRTEVSLDKVPQDFIDAFIATEDRGRRENALSTEIPEIIARRATTGRPYSLQRDLRSGSGL